MVKDWSWRVIFRTLRMSLIRGYEDYFLGWMRRKEKELRERKDGDKRVILWFKEEEKTDLRLDERRQTKKARREAVSRLWLIVLVLTLFDGCWSDIRMVENFVSSDRNITNRCFLNSVTVPTHLTLAHLKKAIQLFFFS